MLRVATRSFVLLSLAVTLTGCGGNPKIRSVNPEQQRTVLVVNNQNFLDFTIYLITGGQRVRLGDATGNRRTKLTIPSHYVFGVSTLQFQADPIGGRRAPISDAISVTAGDEVELTIPPGP
jgi:hypothetical protein